MKRLRWLRVGRRRAGPRERRGHLRHRILLLLKFLQLVVVQDFLVFQLLTLLPVSRCLAVPKLSRWRSFCLDRRCLHLDLVLASLQRI